MDIDEERTVGWHLLRSGKIQTVYAWIKNPNITVTFSDAGTEERGEGTLVSVMYGNSPIGFVAHSKDSVKNVTERLLPMINNELNWFITRFRNLLAELSDRISNNYALIDAIGTGGGE